MKGNRKQYSKVEQLPSSALSVANFAAGESITVSYVYKKFNEGKASYTIVDFQGYNFVISN